MKPVSRQGLFFGSLAAAAIFSCYLQVAIESSAQNAIPALLCGLSSAGILCYLWRTSAFNRSPVAALALLGFTFTSQLGALLFQTIRLEPFTKNLRAPELTFHALAVMHIIAALAHWLSLHFRPLSNISNFASTKLLEPLGALRVRDPLYLWLLALPGFFSLVGQTASFGNVIGKALEATEFLTWLPFLILAYYKKEGGRYCDIRKQVPLLIGYALLIAALGLARNARGLMFTGPATVALIYLVISLRDSRQITRRSLTRWLLALSVLLASVFSLSDLVTAMAIARENREDATRMEMIRLTAEALMDTQKMQQHRDTGYLRRLTTMYDETYLENPIMSRLTETKFHDNIFFLGGLLGEEQISRIVDEEVRSIIVLLPQPVLDMLNIDIQKFEHLYSIGDVYINMAYGYSLGGFVTGSVFGDIYTLCGPYWPLAALFLLTVTFIALNSLNTHDGLVISPVALCLAWPIFLYGVGGESIAAKVGFLLRALPQKILVFVVLAGTLNAIMGLFNTPTYQVRTRDSGKKTP